MFVSKAGVLARVEPFYHWHTPIAWTGYILLVPPIWLGFIFLLDPLNARAGAESQCFVMYVAVREWVVARGAASDLDIIRRLL